MLVAEVGAKGSGAGVLEFLVDPDLVAVGTTDCVHPRDISAGRLLFFAR